VVDNFPDSRNEILRKKGAKLSSTSERSIRFVGQDRQLPFLDAAVDAAVEIGAGNPDFAELGEAYATSEYQRTPGSSERTYEPVYGDDDFSVSISDPGVRRALDEAFGNVDGEAGTETGLTKTTLIEVFGRSSALPNLPSLRERGSRSYRSQNGAADFPDESTSGVRGVEDTDAPIEPVI
jgi:hypothetical protein